MTAILTFITSACWGGFVAATLWGWFLIPLGLPAILWWQAAGIVTTVFSFSGYAGAFSVISGMKAMEIEDDKHQKYAAFVFSILLPACALLNGWLLKTLGPIVEAAK